MRTNINTIYMGTVPFQTFLHMAMYVFHVCQSHKSASDSTLISHYDNLKSMVIKSLNRFLHMRQEIKLTPIPNIVMWCSLYIYNSIPIKKDGLFPFIHRFLLEINYSAAIGRQFEINFFKPQCLSDLILILFITIKQNKSATTGSQQLSTFGSRFQCFLV